LWSVLFSPSVVFDTMGKKATIQAQMRSAVAVSFTQMMMSGAIATTGVTCRITAYGKKDSSIHFDCANSTAISTPSTVAAVSAASVIRIVTMSEG
jgi:hypothetical protein